MPQLWSQANYADRDPGTGRLDGFPGSVIAMTAKSERLTVLSDAEQEALYGLPDFDDPAAAIPSVDRNRQLEDESSAGAKQSFVAEQVRRQQDTPQVGRLLSLYIDGSR